VASGELAYGEQSNFLSTSRPSSSKNQPSQVSTGTTATNSPNMAEGDSITGRKRRRRGNGSTTGSVNESPANARPVKSGNPVSKFFSSVLSCCRKPEADVVGEEEKPARKATRPVDEPVNKSVPTPVTRNQVVQEKPDEITSGDSQPMSEKTALPTTIPDTTTKSVMHDDTITSQPKDENSKLVGEQIVVNGGLPSDLSPVSKEVSPPPPAPEVPESSIINSPPAIITNLSKNQDLSSGVNPAVVHTPPTPLEDERTIDDTSATTYRDTTPLINHPLIINPNLANDKRQSTGSVAPTTPIEDDGTHIVPIVNENREIDEDTEAQAADIGMVPVQEGVIVETPAPIEKQDWLLPTLAPEFKGKKCLVLDLDETLVHSSFKVCCSMIVSR